MGEGGLAEWQIEGFTVQDQLNGVGVDLNIPPFLSGCKQLLRKEVEQIWKIASVLT